MRSPAVGCSAAPSAISTASQMSEFRHNARISDIAPRHRSPDVSFNALPPSSARSWVDRLQLRAVRDGSHNLGEVTSWSAQKHWAGPLTDPSGARAFDLGYVLPWQAFGVGPGGPVDPLKPSRRDSHSESPSRQQRSSTRGSVTQRRGSTLHLLLSLRLIKVSSTLFSTQSYCIAVNNPGQ